MAPSPTFGNPLALISSLASLFANQNGGATGGVPGIAAGLLGTGLFPTGAGTSAGLGATGATPRAIPGVRAPAAAQPASPFPGYMSPQQQLALAKQEALAQLQPIIDEYHYQQDQAQKLAAAQSAVAQARGDALANIDTGIAPQIGQNYKQAADATAGYAKGYGTDLQNTVQSQTDANNATLDKVSGGVGARQTAPNLSDVLFGTMGKLPADTLQAQGAAFKSAADMRPSTDRGLGLQDASQALNQGLVQQGTLAHQLDTYLKQQPGLVSSALAQIGKDQQGLYNTAQTAKYRQGVLDQGNTRLLLSQVNTLTAQTGTIHALNAKGDIVDTGVPTPATRREAQSTAANLATQTGTVWRVNGKAQVFQPVDKQGNPLPTLSSRNAGSAADSRNQTLLLHTADSLTRGTGLVYQVTPDGKGVAPMLDTKGNPVQTPQGRAADANIQAIQTSIASTMSRQSGVQYGVNPDGSITPLKDGKGKTVPTAAQANTDRAFSLDRQKYLRSLDNDKRTALNQLATQSGFLWQYDANGKPVPLTGSDGKPVVTAAERHRQTVEGQGQTRIANAADLHDAQLAAQQATALSQTGVVYLPVKTPKGWKAVPQLDAKGNPLLTVAARKALTSGGNKPLDTKTRLKFEGDAGLIAKNAHDGFTDKNGVKHPPLSYDDALKELTTIGGAHGAIPPKIAVAALSAYYPEGSGPGSRPYSPKTLTSPQAASNGVQYVRMAGINDRVMAVDADGNYLGMIAKSDPGFGRARSKAKLWDGVPGHLPGEKPTP